MAIIPRSSAFVVLSCAVAYAYGFDSAQTPWEWLSNESPELWSTILNTLRRLSLAVGLGLGLGLSVAFLMRKFKTLEHLLTPWVLFLMAVPWVMILISINLIPTIGLTEYNGIIVAGLASSVPLMNLGRRKIAEKRNAQVPKALNYAFFAILAAELLSYATGLGSKVRYYSTYFQVWYLLCYVLCTLLLWWCYGRFSTLIRRFLSKTTLISG